MTIAVLLIIPVLITVVVVLSSWRMFKDVTVMIWRAYFNLGKMVGPKAYPLIGTLWQVKTNSCDLTYQLLNWASTYAYYDGSTGLVKGWIGPIPLVLVLKPENVKKLLESNTLITKAEQYGKLADTNEKWFGRRKMLTPAFHFNVLKDYQEIFSKEAQIMVDLLEGFADTGREVDLFPYVKRCALDVICETAMSTQMNAQMGKNSEYVKAVARLSDLVFLFIRSPWLWFKPVCYGCGLGFEFDRLVKMTTDFTRQANRRQSLIDEGRMDESEIANSKKKISFLDLMLLTQKKNALSDEDIREEVDTFMFEGHDTTSSSMGWSIWLIGQYPEYQAKVHEEMDAVFGDDDREPSEADLKKCVYLEKCIKESLRLCPPVPFFARRLTHDVVMDGFTIPKDVTAAILPMGSHRDPEQWEQPNIFYPDHFEPEAVAKRHPFAYIPFSAGPRNCIGQKFALAEEKTVLSYFFRKYRVEPTTPLPGNRFVPELILKPEDGVTCHLFKRVRAW
ncbi:hypothetical protein PRIPAC_81990 [Pristionchus pacificus]|uniref:Cytochrome P450 n=1 Tax=Pristionchus pacificus TaxID=54126 RepID=A0A2A6CJS2_PRIPA|nr:hypothetical protein PRIPAC_81990 [Pristionchus pacificus]|eukprot:PDM78474.1 cytochrome P450 [Pristionchus pacificus]